MDQIDKIENDLRMIKIALLGDDAMNIKGMKQQLVELSLETDKRVSIIEDSVIKTNGKILRIENKNKKRSWFMGGALAGGGAVAGAAGKAFWIKIITFIGGLFSGAISLTYLYTLL